ncbi:hypothetical protein HOU25_gp43 [Corynebacterium phage Juicebox]|uniref:Uncharacterized protein n=1 Tax=Corynebacterium phage Juicebox TaxID=2301600 RepID=A0A385UCJ5_9CAUD|nr:hypothetical protein HOU25_gp43 [Corynebacterium phage Juicebox]AYB69472.1 hypothetical protein JUICEBOX_43 [Corynebacterium phage Juicebox]
MTAQMTGRRTVAPRRPTVRACAWIAVRETVGLLLPRRWR